MSITALVLLAIGLALLVAGAEILVKGASRIATTLGLSPLVIGLTIVAYGTSAPEMAVSIQASLNGQADISLGNVVGSNIFNVLLILGLSAVVTPLIVAKQLVRLDVPIMVGVSALLLMFGMDGTISRVDGIILAIGSVIYTVFLIYQGREEEVEEDLEESSKPAIQRWLTNIGFIGGGLALLVLGSHWLVSGAIAIARAIGLSELVIGLTIIAAGTSLPELATSIVASMRGKRDIAVGNVVGSNIFNILAVLGFSAIVSPDGVTVAAAAIRFDIPVMVTVAIACLPIFFSGNIITRWEGFLLLAYYAAYTAYLVLASTNHDALPIFSWVLGVFVVPITVLTLGLITARTLYHRRLAKASSPSPEE